MEKMYHPLSLTTVVAKYRIKSLYQVYKNPLAKTILSCFFIILFLFLQELRGQLLIPNTSAQTQNFNGMGSSGTAMLPTGFKITADASPNYTGGTNTTATTQAAGTSGVGVLSSSSAGGAYNFADGVTASSPDRALGFLNSGSFTSPRSIMLELENTTGATITQLDITFDYEKYRTGTRAFDWTFFSGSDGTNWTAQSNGNQPYAADISPNAVVNPPTTISKTVTITGLTITNNSKYYLRWTFTGNGGSTNGQGIGIDNFSVTATTAAVVPTVTIAATDASAAETLQEPGTFRITRTGATTATLDVSYTIGGTASSGDYTPSLTGTATIPIGQSFVDIMITPVDDASSEGNETVILTLVDGAAYDLGATTSATVTITDNDVADVTPPTVTINQGAMQVDPTSTSPIVFTVVFSEAVTDFDDVTDVTLSGTAGATTVMITPVNTTTYTVSVSGMTTNGTVIASVVANAAKDAANNNSAASTSTDNTVTFNGFDVTPPTVTINQGAMQVDPTSTSPIVFTVVFSEAVTDFDDVTDVTLSGTAGATTVMITPVNATTYTVSVSGMTTNGTVIASVVANAAKDAANNNSAASTSIDNTVTYNVPCTVDVNGATINSTAGPAQVCRQGSFALTADPTTSTGLSNGNKIDWYYNVNAGFTPGTPNDFLGASNVTLASVIPTRNTCTDIAAGEIAFVSFQSDDPDMFAFVPLVNLGAGATIRFTDNGWSSGGSFRSGEGDILWTAPTGGVPAGTVITVTGGGTFTTNVGTVTTNSDFLLSVSGDQIIAFCGTVASPTKLLSGIQFGGATWNANADNSNTSALPTGLTNGTSAVAVGDQENGRFKCTGGTVSGTAATLASNINNSANWETSATAYTPSVNACTYTVTGTPTLTISTFNASIDACGTFYIKGIVNPLPTNCSVADVVTNTLQVNVLCPTASISGNVTICEGQSTTLSLNISGAPANQSISGNITNGTVDVNFTGNSDANGDATIQVTGVTQGGTYTIEAISVGGAACPSVATSGSALVTVVNPPVVTIGNQSPVVCSSRPFLLSSLQASITLNNQAYTGTWDVLEADSDGTFRNANNVVNDVFGTAVSFVPGATDIERGFVTLILRSSNPDGPCDATEASVKLTILRVDCGDFPWNGSKN